MQARNPKRDGPGVPEALPQALGVIRERLGTGRVDALWLFPPLVRGRSERGLVVASCFVEHGDRRRLFIPEREEVQLVAGQ